VPDNATVNDPFVALLVTARFSEAAPLTVGAKVTLTVHEAPAARVLPQVVVCANGALVAIEEIDAVAVPVLEIVTVWAALVVPSAWVAKDTEVGDAVRVALPGAIPVPVKATVSELLVALLATVKLPESLPAEVGVKVTDAVHEEPAAREVPQLVLSANGDAALIEEIEAAAVPVSVKVTV
jgi:hypothetical protein